MVVEFDDCLIPSIKSGMGYACHAMANRQIWACLAHIYKMQGHWIGWRKALDPSEHCTGQSSPMYYVDLVLL